MHFRTAVFKIDLIKEILTYEQEIFTNKKGLKRFSLMITHTQKRFSQVIMNKKRFASKITTKFFDLFKVSKITSKFLTCSKQ